MKKGKIITLSVILFLSLVALGVFFVFKDAHKITYVLHGGEKVKNKTIVWDNDVVELKSPTKYAYTFTGWEDKYGNVYEKLENVKKDLVLHATWELDPEYYGDLPVIEINTKYGELPENKKDYVVASLDMYNCQDESHNLENKDIGIRLRGNTTQKYDKKPYRIKFKKPTPVLGMESNKSWVLLADWLDQSSIRNYSAFNLAQQMPSLTFANSANHVVLTIDGEYKGLYLLTEQIDEKEGRTGVGVDEQGEEIEISTSDKSFPFLVEMDRNALREGITGVDNFKTCFYPCEIKYPESDERGLKPGEKDVVFDYISEYVNAAFSALLTGGEVDVSFNDSPMRFEDLVDVDSFMEFWLVNEIMLNKDAVWGSVYLSKTQNGKITFGPVWDFDWSMCSQWTGRPYQFTEIELATTTNLLSNGSMLDVFISNQSNYNKLCEKWDNVKSGIDTVIDKLTQYKAKLVPIAQKDAKYWYGNKPYSIFVKSPEEQVVTQYDYVIEFLSIRKNYLDEILIESNYNSIAK